MEKKVKQTIISIVGCFILALALTPYIGTRASESLCEYVGDVDGDGYITTKDAVQLNYYLLGGRNIEVELVDSDVDQDGAITPKDVTMLKRYLAGGFGVELPKKEKEEPIVIEDGKLTMLFTYGQSDARAMLDMINNYRKENGKYVDSQIPYVYDYVLEKAAMQRAAEIAVKFDTDRHTRPDGGDYKTTLSEYGFDVSPRNILYGENILFGTENSMKLDQAFAEFVNKEGTRKLILGYYYYIGIGHIRIDKTDFWVILFSDEEYRNTAYTEPVDSEIAVTLPIPDVNSLYNGVKAKYVSGELTVPVGSSVALPVFDGCLKLYGSEVDDIKVCNLVFLSGDEYVSVSNGMMTGLKPGTGTIYGKVLGKVVGVSIEVTE
ncbi:MAG: hypothetical protein K6E47_07350 [Lachnospiraceae bacterium]|nr:hypothetical protein [Lachnospiraceae bacterium]